MIHNSTHSTRRSFRAIFLLIIPVAFLFHTAAASANHCETAVPVDLDSTLRGSGYEEVKTYEYSVVVPDAGILTLDVSVPGRTSVSPMLGLSGADCSGDGERALVVVERSATHLVLAATAPGTHFFFVAAQDSRLPLGDYKLRTAFLATETREADQTVDFDSAGARGRGEATVTHTSFYRQAAAVKNEPEEIEPDPGSSIVLTPDAGDDSLLLSLLTIRAPLANKNEPEEIEPDPGSKSSSDDETNFHLADFVFFHQNDSSLTAKNEPEEIEPDPGSTWTGDAGQSVGSTYFVDPDVSGDPENGRLAQSISKSLGFSSTEMFTTHPGMRRFRNAGLCRGGEQDDHGDTMSCATPVEPGRSVAGTIGNGWGDDADVFELTLTRLLAVDIEAAGGLDTIGVLFDQHGQRLAMDDDSGNGDNFRISRTLVPGRYYLRVEGERDEQGSYEILIGAQGR